MNHTHSVVDTDKHFVIDAISRKITTQSDDLVLMQGDHNSEIYTFEIPKVIEGHDMSLCNRVEVHYNNISSSKVEKSSDVYTVTDLGVDGTDAEKLVFSWLLSGNATKYAGALGFRVRFCCVDDNGVYTYKWHTDVYKGISVSEGLDNTAAVEEDFSDAFSEWEARLEALEEGGIDIPENVETTDNKVTEINENSTDEQYPSAKAVYDLVSCRIVLSSDDFQNGQYASGVGITPTDYSIITKTSIPVYSGAVIKVVPNDGYKVWFRLVNNEDLSVAANIYNGGNSTESREYTATQDGWLTVQIANANGTKITPTDYACEISIENNKEEKQEKLVSGQNIKTINGESILGAGDITVEGGDEIPELKTINGVSLVGSGNIVIEGVETDGESSDVSNLRGELKEALGEKEDYEDITNSLTITAGAIQTTGQINANRTQGKYCEKIAVKSGEKYRVSGSYNSAHALLYVYDSNGNPIERYDSEGNSIGNEYYFKTTAQSITGVGDNFDTKPFEYIVPDDVAFIACSTCTVATYPLKVEKWIVEYNNIPNLIDELKIKHNEDISKTEKKIDDDIVALDKKLTLTVENICPNSNFEGVPATSIDEKLNWMADTTASLEFKNNIATFIANGSTNRSRMKMNIGSSFFKDHIYYIQASIKSSPKTTNEGFTFYTSEDSAVSFFMENPRLKNSLGLFNDYYANIDFSHYSTNGVQLWVTSLYSLPTDALNQPTQVKNFFICDLTESFGAGNEPSASEFYNILKAGGSWFKGSKQIFMVDLIKPLLPIVSDYVITVGENGDCQTINEAIEKASSVYPVYKKRGIKIEIRILDGTVIDEQILVESLDLSYISITTDNPDNKVIVTPTANNWDKNTVSHDSRGNMPFFAGEFGARLPMIKCLFSCTSPTLQIEDKTIGIVGYYCNRGSMGLIVVGSAYPENVVGSGAPDIEAEVGFEGFYDCIIANNNSEITLRECIARNAARYGIMSRHISRVSARSADITGCQLAAAYADRSSMADVRFADISGSLNGIQSYNTSNITAVETIANDLGGIVVESREGSIVNCDKLTVNNTTENPADVFRVVNGGTIVATNTTPTNVTGRLYSAGEVTLSGIDKTYAKEPNTVDKNGVIYAQQLI